MRSLTVTDGGGKLATLILYPGDYGIKATAVGFGPWMKARPVTQGDAGSINSESALFARAKSAKDHRQINHAL